MTYLPRDTRACTCGADRYNRAEKNPAERYQMSARLVLAEPDARLREVLALLLRREGHSVLTAQDGADALALIRRKLPDLAVLRGAMPDPDGVALANQLAR